MTTVFFLAGRSQAEVMAAEQYSQPLLSASRVAPNTLCVCMLKVFQNTRRLLCLQAMSFMQIMGFFQ